MPEVKNFQENLGLNNNSPEQLEKIQNELKDKIDQLKQDGSFSDEDLTELVDLLDDKTILSPTEAELKESLKNMQDLSKQIDFLLALIQVDKKISIRERIANKIGDLKDKTRNFVDSFKGKPDKNDDEKNENFNLNEKQKNFLNDLEKNLEENNFKKELLKNTEKILSNNPSINLDNLAKKITEVNNLLEKTNSLNLNKEYTKTKGENISKILNKLNIEEDLTVALNWIKLEIYDIAYDEWKNFNEWKNLFEKDLDNISSLEEAVALFEYVSRNFQEIDDKWIRFWESSLSSLDNKDEAKNFQNKLLEKINKFLKEINKESKTKKYYKLKKDENWLYTLELKETNSKSSLNKSLKENTSLVTKNKSEEYQKKLAIYNKQIEDFSNDARENLKNALKQGLDLKQKELIALFWSLKPEEKETIDNIIKYFSIKNRTLDLKLVNNQTLEIFLNSNLKIDSNNLYSLPINKDYINWWKNLYLLFNKILKSDFSDKEHIINNIMQKVFIENDWNIKSLIKWDLKNLIKENDILKKIFQNFIEKGKNIPKEWEILSKIREINNKEDLEKYFSNMPSNLKNKPETIHEFLKKVNEFRDKWITDIRISNFYNFQSDLDLCFYILIKTWTIIDKGSDNNKKPELKNKYLKNDEINTIIDFISKEIFNWNKPNINESIYNKEENIKGEEEKIIKLLTDFSYAIFKEEWKEEIIVINENIKEYKNSKINKLEDNEKNDKKEKLKNSILGILKWRIEDKKMKNVYDEINKFINNDNIDDTVIDKLNETIFESLKIDEKHKYENILKEVTKKIQEHINENIKDAKTYKSIIKIELAKLWITEKDINEIRLNLKEIKEKNKLKQWENFSEKKFLEEFLEKKYPWEWKNKKIRDLLLNDFFNEEKLQKQEISHNYTKTILNNTTEYVKFISDWASWNFEDWASKNNIPLKNEKGEIINQKELNKESNSSKNNFKFDESSGYFFNENYAVDTKNWILKTKWWENINLSTDEKNMINNSPENSEKIINFYSSLETVWLKNIFQHREQIFSALNEKSDLNFNYSSKEYISERENKIFINAILNSIWEETISLGWSTENFLSQVDSKNNRTMWWGNATEWINNLTHLENNFRNKFIDLKNPNQNFKKSDFIDSLDSSKILKQ